MSNMGSIDLFERTVANYAGSKYAIAISSGTNAIFLSLLHLKSVGELKDNDVISIPCKTYLSVPMSIINAGLKVRFVNKSWAGVYNLSPSRVYDGGVRFTEDMYIEDSLQCLSFQYKKILPLGRGGMVLTNDIHARDWLRQARHNGKHVGVSKWDDVFDIIGWDMYITPEDAERGLALFNRLPNINDDCGCYADYPNLTNQEVFK